jgi:hypothetical protein
LKESTRNPDIITGVLVEILNDHLLNSSGDQYRLVNSFSFNLLIHGHCPEEVKIVYGVARMCAINENRKALQCGRKLFFKVLFIILLNSSA